MPYRICKTFEIESGHLLAKHPDKCRFPHGHSRRVECILEADTLNASEMVCDFKVLKDAMIGILDQFDHALCVNTDDPKFEELKASFGERIIPFEKVDPTTEILAKRLHDHLRARLHQLATIGGSDYPVRTDLRVVRVRIWETSSTWAEYSEG